MAGREARILSRPLLRLEIHDECPLAVNIIDHVGADDAVAREAMSTQGAGRQQLGERLLGGLCVEDAAGTEVAGSGSDHGISLDGSTPARRAVFSPNARNNAGWNAGWGLSAQRQVRPSAHRRHTEASAVAPTLR
jgi:hypothetical protein